MSNLTVFQFESRDIEVVVIDGDPWFNGSQAASALGYKNPAEALKDNVSAKYSQQLDLKRRGKKPVFLSEPGLYQLIMRSNLPSAERFQDWVFEKVLPSIRKTGSYNAQPQTSYYFDRLKQFLKDGKVPVGYFCVFRETLELVGDLEGKGCILPQSVTPDLSVGICWANHLRSQGIDPKSVSIKYDHRFPNDPRGTVKPYAYEDPLLADFRKWFHHQYQTEKLPKYLKGKYPDALPALSNLLGIPEKILLKLK